MKPKTDAERAKAYRERKKLRDAGLLPQPEKREPLEIPRTMSLSEFIQARGEELIEAFEWLKDYGLPVEQFHTAEHKAQEIEWTHNLIRDLDIALSTVTSTLSNYWLTEIDREIERLKSDELDVPAKREDALSKIVRLTDMRKSLERTYRLTLQNFEPEE
ncbi:MAG: hypothetical protein K5872_15995 [Rhizobiaceae bacterium]|nr:hypothetical protein [Rhizobiaceae bacterium]MCV0407725.1 hypothetical protein [Rhizobiaceae bacterium]